MHPAISKPCRAGGGMYTDATATFATSRFVVQSSNMRPRPPAQRRRQIRGDFMGWFNVYGSFRQIIQHLVAPSLEAIQGQLEAINARVDALNVKLDARIDGLDAKIDGQNTRIDVLDTKIDV